MGVSRLLATLSLSFEKHVFRHRVVGSDDAARGAEREKHQILRYPGLDGCVGIVSNKDKPSCEISTLAADLVQQGLSVTHPRSPWKWAQGV